MPGSAGGMPWARLPSSFGSRLTLLDDLDDLGDVDELDDADELCDLGDGPDPGAPGLDTDDTASLLEPLTYHLSDGWSYHLADNVRLLRVHDTEPPRADIR